MELLCLLLCLSILVFNIIMNIIKNKYIFYYFKILLEILQINKYSNFECVKYQEIKKRRNSITDI